MLLWRSSTPAGALSYFTFLGGSLADSGVGVAADATGNAYVTGSTVSTDFPVTSPVFQHAYGGGNADAFVAKLNSTGTILTYSSYLGGTNTEIPGGIAIDTSGAAYVAGQTCSLDFPLSNPLQASAGGNCDAFISKISILGGIAINPAGLVFPAQSLGTNSQPQTVTLTNTNDVAAITIGPAFLPRVRIPVISRKQIPAAQRCPPGAMYGERGISPQRFRLAQGITDDYRQCTGEPSSGGSERLHVHGGAFTLQASSLALRRSVSQATLKRSP